MKLDVHIDALEDGLSKVESKPKASQNKQIVQGQDKKPNGNYAKKPETTKSEQDGTFLDLNKSRFCILMVLAMLLVFVKRSMIFMKRRTAQT